MLLESRCTRSICWFWFLGSSSILLVTLFETPCIQGNFATVHPTNQRTNQVGYNITCQVCSNLRLSEEEVAGGREGWRWRGWVLCGRSTKIHVTSVIRTFHADHYLSWHLSPVHGLWQEHSKESRSGSHCPWWLHGESCTTENIIMITIIISFIFPATLTASLCIFRSSFFPLGIYLNKMR